MRAAKPCSHPGCPNLAPCPTHTQRAWAGRAPRSERYPPGWERIRKQVLARDRYVCACGARATQVDHVVGVAEGGNHSLSNLRAICPPCHDIKSRAEAVKGRALRR